MSQTVVIIEDNETSADIIARQLQAVGFDDAHKSDTAADGMSLIGNMQPPLVVIDERLPDASGTDIARQIRAQRPDVTIIMCTVVDDELMVQSAFEAGCNYYAIKPNGFRALCGQYTSPRTMLNATTQEVYK
jgi:DNA-binding response OmpR family regulator